MISSSGTSYRKKWNSSSAVAELAFRLSVICRFCICQYRVYEEINIQNEKALEEKRRMEQMQKGS